MTNKLTVTYQGTPIINEKEIEGDCDVIYNGSTVQTISTGEEVRLNTKDKYTSDFISIAGEKLNTAGKLIKDFITIKVVDNTNYLCFTAQENNSTVGLHLNTTYGPVPNPPTLEYSKDLITWMPLVIGSTTITLSLGEKVYLRGDNPYISPPGTSYGNVMFNLTGKLAASGSLISLLDKTCELTNISSDWCFSGLFYNCTALTSAPELTATNYGYAVCYELFYGCSNLKVSSTQDTTYRTPFRIPTTGTGSVGTYSFANMLAGTGGTFKGTPLINTTYYGAW